MIKEAMQAIRSSANLKYEEVGNVIFLHSSERVKADELMAAISIRHGLSDTSLLTYERLNVKLYEKDEELQEAKVGVMACS